MGKFEKVLRRVLSGTSDANIAFDDLCWLLHRLGFHERVNGSHHIFSRDGFQPPLNLQPSGRQAKPYQVEQVRRRLVESGIMEED